MQRVTKVLQAFTISISGQNSKNFSSYMEMYRYIATLVNGKRCQIGI